MSLGSSGSGRYTTLASIMARVEVGPGPDPDQACWLWTGCVTGGYGQIDIAYRRGRVHRVVYELLVGAVPEELDLDHLCRQPLCVNPRHLEPVTRRENILRGSVPSANRSRCKADLHDITTPGSIYVDSEGVERCRECRLESKRAHRRRAAAMT